MPEESINNEGSGPAAAEVNSQNSPTFQREDMKLFDYAEKNQKQITAGRNQAEHNDLYT